MDTQKGWNLQQSYTKLPDAFYTKANPSEVEKPELVLFNEVLADELGLSAKPDPAIFGGNVVPEGAEPIAQAYAGHQFGQFTMLGDGRAVLLGEQVTPEGERYDIQLKGSGRTPFSRGGDGRATLGPMLREYIISEAMHGLGIPTNRSLAVVTSGEYVQREDLLPGAVLTRVASSHLRIGTFQYAAGLQDYDKLKALADYTIERHAPELVDFEQPYLSFFEKVIERQAYLIAQWQLVGFIHGVMNTDNMTISGETIDYGPCAFMDTYNPKTVFSSIDRQGRYAYMNQPPIGAWNLARFAETLLPLFHEDQEKAVEMAQEAHAKYEKSYHSYWLKGMRSKLGMTTEEAQDQPLIEDLLEMMEKNEADYTNTFRALTLGRPNETAMYGKPAFTNWYKQWQARLERQESSEADVRELMKRTNPSIIPRNHRVEEALDAAVEEGDFSVAKQLLAVLADPYAYSEDQEVYAELPEPSAQPYRTFCGT
ncbi:YdiU family protein [Halobacillus litoralis]|uniref:Protein nucleotidyltransferase YdiU n=1 Tax=Halobacillus litoralis TaxID=45668 RepID=A0A845E5N9_9BACI|nr:YdiU family protein [Halobacillus litoralis]MYL50570.1 YdiU family protein [Halobacillus litoralis]